MSFAVDIYRRAAAPGGNVVLSPYSIAAALRMLLAGARGETAEEIARVVPHEPSPVAGALSANRLWVAERYPIHPEFRAVAPAVELDFSRNVAAAARINAWISETTRGRIDDLVPARALGELTRLVLTNAVYLKASWEQSFDEARDAAFHLTPEHEVRVPMMALDGVWLSAARIAGGRAFELPYRGGETAMLVCLPDAIDGLPQIEASLDPSAWTLAPRHATVLLPRFCATSDFDLAAILQAMGIRRAFDAGAADLRGISDEPGLSVSAAVHKARIDVDEEGTEAAAATAMAVAGMAAPVKKEVFHVDRPFLFLIRAANGEIVFIGRVVDPR